MRDLRHCRKVLTDWGVCMCMNSICCDQGEAGNHKVESHRRAGTEKVKLNVENCGEGLLLQIGCLHCVLFRRRLSQVRGLVTTISKTYWKGLFADSK